MFKLFHPNKIFQITSKAPKYVLILFVMVLSVGLTEALILSPEDYKQSDAVRIMYVHVPAAWISLGIFSSRRRHTRSKRDWSSDVCSSDLFYS